MFNIQPSGDGYFFINLVGTNLYLDIEGGHTHNGADIIVWPMNGGNNQKWKFSTF
jgi:hypothetical protein